jgi:cytosine/adenosine deaminase-related metal-dependent hydrolase
MFREMHLAALIQKPGYGPMAMPARTVLRMATAGGAAALGIGEETGSIVAGKRADLLLLDLNTAWSAPAPATQDALAAAIVHSCTPGNVHSVMIDGAWVYRQREHTTLDVQRAVAEARTELDALLTRVVP